MTPSVSVLLSWLACAGELWLLGLIVLRGRSSPLLIPLSLLTVSLLGWNVSSLVWKTTQVPSWLWLSRIFGPWLTPLAAHVILVLCGKRRAYKGLLAAFYGLFGALSLWALTSPLREGLHRTPIGWSQWELIFLLLLPVPTALALYVLVRHLKESHDDNQIGSTQMLLLAAGFLAFTAVTELLPESLNPPRLVNVGSVFFNFVITFVALRLRVVDNRSRAFGAFLFVTMAFLAAVVLISLQRMALGQQAVAWVAAAVVAATGLMVWRQTSGSLRMRRERQQHLAFLGRMSAQLSHDLRNPLAAAKGASQFLLNEMKAGRSLDGQIEMIDLMAAQLERMERVVEQYQRMSRVEPQLQNVSLNQMVTDTTRLSVFAATPGVRFEVNLDKTVPTCRFDADLVVLALENVLRNAVQALEPKGGVIRVSTALLKDSDVPWVRLSVEDNGPGMSAQVRERAFDEFFTTRANGSGLGLAFVRRVAEVHGGLAEVKSVESKGTTVELRWPVMKQE